MYFKKLCSLNLSTRVFLAKKFTRGIRQDYDDVFQDKSTVKLSRKDDIRIMDPAAPNNLGEKKRSENPRRKPSGNVRKQSRELLRRVNQEKESESEGYHSDCMLSNVLKKNSRNKSSLERRQKYSSIKQRKDSRKKENSDQSTSSSASSSRDNYGLSKTKTSTESTGSNKSVVIRN